MSAEKVSIEELARRYCESQESTTDDVLNRLEIVRGRFRPDGFMLLRCEDFCSSRFGHQVILPYGGAATFKSIPEHPVSPRGLASEMSVVVAYCEVEP